MVEESYSRSLVRFMILTAWISFVISIWLLVWFSNLFYFSIFWFVIVICLASLLSGRKR
jgi:hypothetical protein